MVTSPAAATVRYGCGASLLKASLCRMYQVCMYIATLLTANPNDNPCRSRHVGAKRRNSVGRSAQRVRRLGVRCVAEVSSAAVLQLLFVVGVRHGRTTKDQEFNGQKRTHSVWQMHILLKVAVAEGRKQAKDGLVQKNSSQDWLGVEGAGVWLPLLEEKRISGISVSGQF